MLNKTDKIRRTKFQRLLELYQVHRRQHAVLQVLWGCAGRQVAMTVSQITLAELH